MANKVVTYLGIAIGIIAVYEIITRTQLLGDLANYLREKSGATKITSPFNFPPATPAPQQPPLEQQPPQAQTQTPAQTQPQTQTQVPMGKTTVKRGGMIQQPSRNPQPNTQPQTQPQPTQQRPQAQVQKPQGVPNQIPSQHQQTPPSTTSTNTIMNMPGISNTNTLNPPGTGGNRRIIGSLSVPSNISGSDQNGCTKSEEARLGITCRHSLPRNTAIPAGEDYGIFATFNTQSGDVGRDKPSISITGGGPGSSGSNCCGITTEIIKDDQGRPYFRIATEDNSKRSGSGGQHTILCSNKGGRGEEGAGPCPGSSQLTPSNIDMTSVQLSWYAQKNADGKSFTYCGKLNDQNDGCFDNMGKPLPSVIGYTTGTRTLGGNDFIIPGMFFSSNRQGSDGNRCRCDGLGECICGGMVIM